MAQQYQRYQSRIVVNPEMMVGKPIGKGTRMPVELVLKLLAQGGDYIWFLKENQSTMKRDVEQ